MPKRDRIYSKWFPPYKIENNKRICSLSYTGPGVYLIKENDIVVYIGRSKTDVKKTLYRHFQKWIDLRSDKTSNGIARITYHGLDLSKYLIKVVLCKSIEDVCTLEEVLIKVLEPRDNTLKASKYGIKYKKIITSKFSEAGF
jgi:hypothetical protein